MDKWKITGAYHHDYSPKEIPQKRIDRIYVIDILSIGLPGFFLAEEGALLTSPVVSFLLKEETLSVETKNTWYIFKKIKKEDL